MAQWTPGKNETYNMQIVQNAIIDLYNTIEGTKFVPNIQIEKITTRAVMQKTEACQMIFHFINTKKIYPQDPHIDYNWKAFEDQKENKIKPSIMFLPLSDDGYIVNVWCRSNDSKLTIKNDERNNDHIYLPYKLIVPKGQVAFLHGDIIHGGGIAPSGERCHGFLYHPSHEKYRGNMPIDHSGENKLLSQTCKIPYSDCKNLGIKPYENILKKQY